MLETAPSGVWLLYLVQRHLVLSRKSPPGSADLVTVTIHQRELFRACSVMFIGTTLIDLGVYSFRLSTRPLKWLPCQRQRQVTNKNHKSNWQGHLYNLISES